MPAGELTVEEVFTAIFPGVAPAERASEPLFRALTDRSHPYLHCRQALFEVLSGRALNTWDIDYLQRRPALWGRPPLVLSRDDAVTSIAVDIQARIGERQALIEYHGARAFARVLSHYDCLRNPNSASSVPLDTKLAEFFGRADWLAAGSYIEAAEELRTFALTIAEERGQHVHAHGVAHALHLLKTHHDWRRSAAGSAVMSFQRHEPSDLVAVIDYFLVKDGQREHYSRAGALERVLAWLVGTNPDLEVAVAPEGQDNSGELRVFSFRCGPRHRVCPRRGGCPRQSRDPHDHQHLGRAART